MRLPSVLLCAVSFAGVAASMAAPSNLESLEQAVAANPSSAPSAVSHALSAVEKPSASYAADVTTTAIHALGAQPSNRAISAIVYAAVRSRPEQVLDIVRAAVLASPPRAAEAIDAAAISAVPNPWMRVIYRKPGVPVPKGERDYKETTDSKQVTDFKGGPDRQTDGIPMSLAQAIVQTTLDTRGDLSAQGLIAAVDTVLRGDPSWMIGAVNDPKGISGVGDAGNNNYANEPRRRKVPTVPPSSPPITSTPIGVRVPTPAPVSQ